MEQQPSSQPPAQFIDPDPTKPRIGGPPAKPEVDDEPVEEEAEVDGQEDVDGKDQSAAQPVGQPAAQPAAQPGFHAPVPATAPVPAADVKYIHASQTPTVMSDVIPADFGKDMFPDRMPETSSDVLLRGEADRVRETRVSKAQEHKEETQEHRWRTLLGTLGTTEICHVKVEREAHDGTLASLGALFRCNVGRVREIENFIPYGDGTNNPVRYVIWVAPGSARPDDDSKYRKFEFSRVGLAAPPGWSIDSPQNWLSQEIGDDDVATQEQISEAAVTKFMQKMGMTPGGMGVMQGQNLLPYGGAGMPFQGQQQQGQNPFLMDIRFLPQQMLQQQPNTVEEDRRRKEREADQARLDAIEKTHRDEMAKLTQISNDANARAAKAEQDAKEATYRADRERADAQHRSDILALGGKLDSAISELALIKSGGGMPKQMDFAPIVNTIVPLINTYLQSSQQNAMLERQSRLEDATRERERMFGESERISKLTSTMGEMQLASSRANAELLTRLQDPSGMMNMTRLLTETIGGMSQMAAQWARTGLGGGGGGAGPQLGELVAQGLQAIGQMATSYADVKKEEMTLMAQQGYPVGMTAETLQAMNMQQQLRMQQQQPPQQMLPQQMPQIPMQQMPRPAMPQAPQIPMQQIPQYPQYQPMPQASQMPMQPPPQIPMQQQPPQPVQQPSMRRPFMQPQTPPVPVAPRPAAPMAPAPIQQPMPVQQPAPRPLMAQQPPIPQIPLQPGVTVPTQPPVQVKPPQAAPPPQIPGVVAQAAPSEAKPQVIHDMIQTVVAAINQEVNPDEVADMLSAILHGAEAFKVGKGNPQAKAFVDLLKTNPAAALRGSFPQARAEYLYAIALSLSTNHGAPPPVGAGDQPMTPAAPEPEQQAPVEQPAPVQPEQQAPPVQLQPPPGVAPVQLQPPVQGVAPVVEIPKRGPGRPRGSTRRASKQAEGQTAAVSTPPTGQPETPASAGSVPGPVEGNQPPAPVES